LSHVRRRAQTIKRHYTVPRGPFVWEKDAPAELPEWFDIVELPARSRRGDPVRYAVANDELALLWLVEYGCVDLHVGTARVDLPERPDFVLFDLDAAGVAFSSVVEAALLLREALDALGLVALPMTTGGEGMHVRVPIARRHLHEDAREFAASLAVALRRARPDLVTLERRPAARHGVYVDTKMNGRGQQVVAPYSVRPLPGAPVATPLGWAPRSGENDDGGRERSGRAGRPLRAAPAPAAEPRRRAPPRRPLGRASPKAAHDETVEAQQAT
jgi:bifunctional non-homologous end joining protein LigD